MFDNFSDYVDGIFKFIHIFSGKTYSKDSNGKEKIILSYRENEINDIGCIKQIIRFKNGFYDTFKFRESNIDKLPLNFYGYNDCKFNVLIKDNNISVIAEIQFLVKKNATWYLFIIKKKRFI